ncbi:MAG: prepilin-type N-terminal cleavage/methylation domain-containing protein [Deltaproteobacteria bacterium]|nr:prepilin-type N-terminal cleavage/methylation domain-containing protein [Deltaproteobacteria bacterium]
MSRGPTISSAGFTLVEALISVTILGFIGAVAYGTFARAVDARERAMHITGRYHQIRQALQRMSTEISMAFVSYHKDCEDAHSVTMFAGKRGGNGGRLDFTSFGHTKLRADANESDQNELSYFVERDPEDPQKNALIRREQAPIDDEPDEGGVEQVLAEDVKSIEFEFYDPKEDRWEDEWDADGSDKRDRLPMFVSIKMVAADPNGKDETFVTKTRVFMGRRFQISGSGFARCLD